MATGVTLLDTPENLDLDPHIIFGFDACMNTIIHVINQFDYGGRHSLPRQARFNSRVGHRIEGFGDIHDSECPPPSLSYYGPR
jgi:hypothetical protein